MRRELERLLETKEQCEGCRISVYQVAALVISTSKSEKIIVLCLRCLTRVEKAIEALG